MRNIYSAIFKVRLAGMHPRFFRCQHGLITIYLVDDSPDTFLRRAELIVQQLHYEIIQAPKLGVFIEAPAPGPHSDVVELTGQNGFGINQIFIDRPTDEESFIATPIP